MTEQDRTIFINPKSTGYKAIKYHYENNDINTKKTNGAAINLKIHKSDLEIFDFIANKFSVPRNWLIAEILETDIDEIFNFFDEKPRHELALLADEEMTKKNMTHEYRGATWYWDAVRPPDDIGNPSCESLQDIIGTNDATR